MSDGADKPVPRAGGLARTDEEAPLPGRRGLLEIGAIACGASAAALAVWPLAAAAFSTGPEGAHEAPWVDLAASAALPEGEPVKAFPSGQRRDGWTVATRELSPV